jgi:hypothetical protein
VLAAAGFGEHLVGHAASPSGLLRRRVHLPCDWDGPNITTTTTS